jgi:hypothetical protein
VRKRLELSTAIGLTLLGKSYQQYIAHVMCGDDTITALRHHQWHIFGPSIMWNRPNPHQARVVEESVCEHPCDAR